MTENQDRARVSIQGGSSGSSYMDSYLGLGEGLKFVIAPQWSLVLFYQWAS